MKTSGWFSFVGSTLHRLRVLSGDLSQRSNTAEDAMPENFGQFLPDPKSRLEIHMLTCRNHVTLALWALASWYGIGRRRDRLCIHDDGTLSQGDYRLFTAMFPGCRVVSKKEADEVAAARLHNFPRVRAFRNFTNLSMKLLDVAFLGSAQEFVRVCILCGFLESDEFGLSGSQALRLQQQIVHVSITAAAAEQSFDVAVDGFHHSHRYLRPAIVQN